MASGAITVKIATALMSQKVKSKPHGLFSLNFLSLKDDNAITVTAAPEKCRHGQMVLSSLCKSRANS
jgi:hypothetical protein